MTYIASHQFEKVRSADKRGAQYLTVLLDDWTGTEKGFVTSWHRTHFAAGERAEALTRHGMRVAIVDITDALDTLKESAMKPRPPVVEPDESKIPVYLGAPGEQTEDCLLGRVSTRTAAAKLIREATGDADYRAADVNFSAAHMAYFSED